MEGAEIEVAKAEAAEPGEDGGHHDLGIGKPVRVETTLTLKRDVDNRDRDENHAQKNPAVPKSEPGNIAASQNVNAQKTEARAHPVANGGRAHFEQRGDEGDQQHIDTGQKGGGPFRVTGSFGTTSNNNLI